MTCPDNGAGAEEYMEGNTLSQCGEALNHGGFPGLDEPASTVGTSQRQLCCSLCSTDSPLSCTRAR